MSSNLQAKLLKVIEDKEFLRVGGTRTIKVDVRFIAATNQNITALVSSGKFREGPVLQAERDGHSYPSSEGEKRRHRPSLQTFSGKTFQKANKKIEGFSREAMDMLMSYGFPGNVRELENIIERAVILEKTLRIRPESLPQSIKFFR